MPGETLRLAILDDYQGAALGFADWQRLDGRAEVTVFHDTLHDHDALAERLAPFEILCLMRERAPMPAELIARLPRLRLLVTTGMKNASIDLAAADARGVTVCGTRSPGHATAELTLALLLALFRGLPEEIGSLRAGGWQAGLGRDLRGATLGLLGLGRLGGEVARLAAAFGMRVQAWSRNLTTARCVEVGEVALVDKERLIAGSDAISIHLRLSERTRGLIGAAEIAAMKPDAFLVNTSRAPIVDTSALVAALRRGHLAGAALDVHEVEPLPADAAVRDCPRLIATPHLGYVTRETYQVFYRDSLEAVLAFLDGSPLRVLASGAS